MNIEISSMWNSKPRTIFNSLDHQPLEKQGLTLA